MSNAKEKLLFPYQNLSLKNLPGEQWKDVPGFEGYYKVSSLGRIKSLARERPSRWAKPIQLPERLLRLKLTVNHNKTVQANLYTLLTTLYKDGYRCTYSVGRLVYHAFVAPFDLEDKSILIAYRDRDGRNLHYKNLYKSTISELKTESFKNGRSHSHLSILSKPVTQFNEKGEPVAHFPSMYDATKKTGILTSAIADVAKGKDYACGGFFWRYGRIKRKLNLSSIKHDRFELPQEHHSLIRKLDTKHIDHDHLAPYLNLSLQSMKGERWKDIPGYEGRYQISNVGRVKTLAGISDGSNRKFRHERIKQLTATDFRLDKEGKEVAGTLWVSLAKKPHPKKMFSVGRLVYYLFVKVFDIENSKLRVYYKDGNSLNIHYRNLELHSAQWSINKGIRPV